MDHHHHIQDISNSTIIVCDIGGTTSDIGMLVNGFIQLSATKCQMAGIETKLTIFICVHIKTVFCF